LKYRYLDRAILHALATTGEGYNWEWGIDEEEAEKIMEESKRHALRPDPECLTCTGLGWVKKA